MIYDDIDIHCCFCSLFYLKTTNMHLLGSIPLTTSYPYLLAMLSASRAPQKRTDKKQKKTRIR